MHTYINQKHPIIVSQCHMISDTTSHALLVFQELIAQPDQHVPAAY